MESDNKRGSKVRRRGRHSRPSKAKKAMAATPAVALAAGTIIGAPSASAATSHQIPRSNIAEVFREAAKIKPAVESEAQTYQVKPGDTLSEISEHVYGKAADWQWLYHENASKISNPNLIYPGQVLEVPEDNPGYTIPAPPRTESRYVPRHAASSQYVPRHARVSEPAATYSGSGAMQRCIIQRESGGNSQVMNSSGHYGLYQFSESTWVASGGSAADFGHASVAEQNRVFASAVAARGYIDWTPYDGCGR